MVYMREDGFKAFGGCGHCVKIAEVVDRSCGSPNRGFRTGRWIDSIIVVYSSLHCVFTRNIRNVFGIPTTHFFHPDQVLTDPRRVVTLKTNQRFIVR